MAPLSSVYENVLAEYEAGTLDDLPFFHIDSDDDDIFESRANSVSLETSQDNEVTSGSSSENLELLSELPFFDVDIITTIL